MDFRHPKGNQRKGAEIERKTLQKKKIAIQNNYCTIYAAYITSATTTTTTTKY